MNHSAEIHDMGGWTSAPPEVDGVALFNESFYILRVMLAEHDRPGLHAQIKRGAWEACEALYHAPEADPIFFQMVSAFNEEVGNPPYDPNSPGPEEPKE